MADAAITEKPPTAVELVWEHDLVFGEARDRQRISQQDGGVDDVDGPRDQGRGDASSRRAARRAPSSFTMCEHSAHATLRLHV